MPINMHGNLLNCNIHETRMSVLSSIFPSRMVDKDGVKQILADEIQTSFILPLGNR